MKYTEKEKKARGLSIEKMHRDCRKVIVNINREIARDSVERYEEGMQFIDELTQYAKHSKYRKQYQEYIHNQTEEIKSDSMPNFVGTIEGVNNLETIYYKSEVCYDL